MSRTAPIAGAVARRRLHRGRASPASTGSIETDYLNGEIALLGRLHNIPTPVNAALQRIATRLAREGAAPGSMRLTKSNARSMSRKLRRSRHSERSEESTRSPSCSP